MKKCSFLILATVTTALLVSAVSLRASAEAETEGKWSGVDETVVEKFAEAAGRPPRDPYINVGEGDMLLFCFLIAGVIGGFVCGYYFRALFKEDRKSPK
ncbi:MAG: cobalt ABC transporter permease [Lentisphaerae bacterium]|nr:cobalt ABC transporter permease [Lentisphaerota bacterium]